MEEVKDEEDQAQKQRKTWARGVYDGLRMVGVQNPEEVMNQAKLDERKRNLTATARKVYDAIPEEGFIRMNALLSVLKSAGRNHPLSVVEGCVADLLDKGLIEASAGSDQGLRRVSGKKVVWLRAPEERIDVSPALSEAQQIESPAQDLIAVETKTISADAPPNPLEKLAELTSRQKAIAAEMTDIAKKIEDAALEVQQYLKAVEERTEKINQVAKLLRSM